MPRHQHRDGGISYDEGARLYREGGGRRPMSEASDDYPVDTVAHAWLVKMRGENPEAHRGEFDAWLSASPDHRSEEHTSELQSLMRISYAVFCLKKKKKHK